MQSPPAPAAPMLSRRGLLLVSGAAVAASALPLRAGAEEGAGVLIRWYRLVLELVRHTPTYSPPVASRAFAYLGVAAWEAVAAARGLQSLAGQLNGLAAPPDPPAAPLDEAALLHGALADAVAAFFGNTGPTGQRAMEAMARQIGEGLSAPGGLREASLAQGRAIAADVLDWSQGDGGAVIENMGFPQDHAPRPDPSAWVPTSLIRQQQAPLLPHWGENRPFAMPSGTACTLPPPPDFGVGPDSPFHAEALEVYEVSRSLGAAKEATARFWSDDPMLSPTPAGHWIFILLDLAEAEGLPADRIADALARLGVAMADAFIACWQAKYAYDLLRPVTYIRRHIDPGWEPLLITPPFPEYPSGHSTLSGAAATVLTAIFGEDRAFADATHAEDGLPVRRFASFAEAAREAAISRLYGGIHFRAAIERGLDQGACVGAHAVALRTLG